MKMKNLIVLIFITFVFFVLLVGCGKSSSTTTSKSTDSAQSQGSTPAGQGNWWDKLGEPKYGGNLTFVAMPNIASGFDPASWMSFAGAGYGDMLFGTDWTLDRSIWDFQGMWVPAEYWKPLAAASWEWKDSQNMIIHIRPGVHWQDKAPANGREFIAQDVEFHFDRMLGTGNGFTEPNPLYLGFAPAIEKVTATDKYTVAVKFKQPGIFVNSQNIFESVNQMFELPEAVKSGEIKDWTKAVGIGPFMLSDYVPDVSLTFSKNPNYWATDSRHPQNKLPYVDSVKLLNIPDVSTQMAALRTGKIDSLDRLSWQQSATLKKTNPEIPQWQLFTSGSMLFLRNDNKPFNDLRVRKALQMALDLKTIAKSHYGGMVEGIPAGLLSPRYKGWNFAYDDWPQELKDGYSYNPQKAKELLVEAGYPNGFKTNVVAGSQGDVDLLQIVKSYFHDIGVEMDIKLMDDLALMPFATGRKHDQMLAFSSFAGHIPNISISSFRTDEARNWGNVKDPAYDAMVDKFSAAPTLDQAKKLAIEADKYYLENKFSVDLFPIVTFSAYQPYLKGYSGESFGMWNIPYYWARLWIDKEKN